MYIYTYISLFIYLFIFCFTLQFSFLIVDLFEKTFSFIEFIFVKVKDLYLLTYLEF